MRGAKLKKGRGPFTLAGYLAITGAVTLLVLVVLLGIRIYRSAKAPLPEYTQAHRRAENIKASLILKDL